MALSWASPNVGNNNNADLSSDHHDDDTHRPGDKLRSIPPWILTADALDKGQAGQPLLRVPSTPVIPHHQFLPESQRGRTARGRRWDHLRDAEPAMLDQTMHESSARWLPFMLSGPQYRGNDVDGAQVMSDEWMEENVPFWTDADANYDVYEQQEKRKSFMFDPARRRGSIVKAKGKLFKNPFVPLIFRVITAVFTLAALGLGGRVYHQTDRLSRTTEQGCTQRASTYMAVVVDTIAVPYIIYVTWDEYTAKPLGLRSATAKTALLLLDLLFMVFYSSNLSLAFDALTDPRWACYSARTQTCTENASICHSQTGLTTVLLVALVSWITTFCISVLRVVKRLRPDEY